MSIHFTSDTADESPDGTANAPITILSNISTRNQYSSDKSYLEEVEVKWRYSQEYANLGSYWSFGDNLPAWPNGIPLSEDLQGLLNTLPDNLQLSNLYWKEFDSHMYQYITSPTQQQLLYPGMKLIFENGSWNLHILNNDDLKSNNFRNFDNSQEWQLTYSTQVPRYEVPTYANFLIERPPDEAVFRMFSNWTVPQQLKTYKEKFFYTRADDIYNLLLNDNLITDVYQTQFNTYIKYLLDNVYKPNGNRDLNAGVWNTTTNTYQEFGELSLQQIKSHAWWSVHHGGLFQSPMFLLYDDNLNVIYRSAYSFITHIDQTFIGDIYTNNDGIGNELYYFTSPQHSPYYAYWLRDGYKKLRYNALIPSFNIGYTLPHKKYQRDNYINLYWQYPLNNLPLDGNSSFEFWFDRAYGPLSITYNTRFQHIISDRVGPWHLSDKMFYHLQSRTFSNTNKHHLITNNLIDTYNTTNLFTSDVTTGMSCRNVHNAFDMSSNLIENNAYIIYSFIDDYKSDISNSIIPSNKIYEDWYINNWIPQITITNTVTKTTELEDEYDNIVSKQLFNYNINNKPIPDYRYPFYHLGYVIHPDKSYDFWYHVNKGPHSQTLKQIYTDFLVPDDYLQYLLFNDLSNSYTSLINTTNTIRNNLQELDDRNSWHPVSSTSNNPYFAWHKQNISGIIERETISTIPYFDISDNAVYYIDDPNTAPTTETKAIDFINNISNFTNKGRNAFTTFASATGSENNRMIGRSITSGLYNTVSLISFKSQLSGNCKVSYSLTTNQIRDLSYNDNIDEIWIIQDVSGQSTLSSQSELSSNITKNQLTNSFNIQHGETVYLLYYKSNKPKRFGQYDWTQTDIPHPSGIDIKNGNFTYVTSDADTAYQKNTDNLPENEPYITKLWNDSLEYQIFITPSSETQTTTNVSQINYQNNITNAANNAETFLKKHKIFDSTDYNPTTNTMYILYLRDQSGNYIDSNGNTLNDRVYPLIFSYNNETIINKSIYSDTYQIVGSDDYLSQAGQNITVFNYRVNDWTYDSNINLNLNGYVGDFSNIKSYSYSNNIVTFEEHFKYHSPQIILEYLLLIYKNDKIKEILESDNLIDKYLFQHIPTSDISSNYFDFNKINTLYFPNLDNYYLKNFVDASDNLTFDLNPTDFSTPLPSINYSSRPRPWSTFFDWLVVKYTGSQSSYYQYKKLVDIGYYTNYDNLPLWNRTEDASFNNLYTSFNSAVVDNQFINSTSIYDNILSRKKRSVSGNNTYYDASNNLITTTYNFSDGNEYFPRNISNGINYVPCGNYYGFIFNELTKPSQAYTSYFNILNIPITRVDPNVNYNYNYNFTVIDVSLGATTGNNAVTIGNLNTNIPDLLTTVPYSFTSVQVNISVSQYPSLKNSADISNGIISIANNILSTTNIVINEAQYIQLQKDLSYNWLNHLNQYNESVDIDLDAAYKIGVSRGLIDSNTYNSPYIWYNYLVSSGFISPYNISLWNELSFRRSLPPRINIYIWYLFKPLFDNWYKQEIAKTNKINFYNGMVSYGAIVNTSYWEWLTISELNNYTNQYLLNLYNYNADILETFTRGSYTIEDWYDNIFGPNSLVSVSDRWSGIPTVNTTDIRNTIIDYTFPFYPYNDSKQYLPTHQVTYIEYVILNNGYDQSNNLIQIPSNYNLKEPSYLIDNSGNMEIDTYNIEVAPFASDEPEIGTYNSSLPYIDSDYFNRIPYVYSNIYYDQSNLAYDDGVQEVIITPESEKSNCASIKCKPFYSKFVTSTNNPQISGKMRYSEFIRTSKKGRKNTSYYLPATLVPEWRIYYGLDLSNNSKIASGIKEIPDNQFRNDMRVNDVLFEDNMSDPKDLRPAKLLRIGSNAFRSSGITTIIIPDTLLDISASAFRNSLHLSDIHIPPLLKIIPYACFYNSNLSFVTGGEGLEFIDNFAFSHTRNLSQFDPSNNMTSLLEIGDYSFYNSGLTNFIFPTNLRIIGKYSFYSNQNLTNITLSKNLLKINDHSFKDCINLNNINFDPSGNLYTIGKFSFYNNYTLSAVNFPSSLNEILQNAFSFCNLSYIHFPTNIKIIGDNAFEHQGYRMSTLIHNETLTNIDISGVVDIGRQAFLNNPQLIDVIFPDTIQYIRKEAFRKCNKIKNVNLPNSVQFLGQGAYRDCIGLRTFLSGGSLDILRANTFNNCYLLNSVVTSAPLKRLGEYCFLTCSSLTSFEQAVSCTEISDGCFQECRFLSRVRLNHKLPVISDYTFYGCNQLRNSAVDGSLFTFSKPDGSDNFNIDEPDQRGSYTKIGKYGLSGTAILRFTVSPKLTLIDEYAFFGASNLVTINLYSSYLTHIESNAFRFCVNLRTLVVPPTVTFMGNNSLYGCISLSELSMSWSQLVSFNILSNTFLPPSDYTSELFIYSRDKTNLSSEYPNGRPILNYKRIASNDPTNNMVTDLIDFNINFGSLSSVQDPPYNPPRSFGYGYEDISGNTGENGLQNTITPDRITDIGGLDVSGITFNFTPFQTPSNIFGLWNNRNPLKPDSVGANVCLSLFKITSTWKHTSSWVGYNSNTNNSFNEEHYYNSSDPTTWKNTNESPAII